MVNRLFATILAALCALSTAAAQEAERIFASSERAVFTIDTPKKVGTGFVLSNGLLVTCYHVVKGVGGRVKLREAPSVRLAYLAHDEKADIAVFTLNSAMPAYLRLREGVPIVGATTYVIGSPLGELQRSISNGIISQVRRIRGLEFLQITAAISPGSSGSPVLDEKGLVTGMVTSTLKEGQANNFAISSGEISRFLTSLKAKEPRTPAIAKAPAKQLKSVGPSLICQFVRPTSCYREPNLATQPRLFVRAKRLTMGQRTASPEWIAIKAETGTALELLYVPAKDVRLYSMKDRNNPNLRDPFDAAPPNGFEKLVSDLHHGDDNRRSAARRKLLSYGPAIVKHVLSLFEHAWDPESYRALLSLRALGRAAKPYVLVFLKDGSETQKEAIARLWEGMAKSLWEAERIASEQTAHDASSRVFRQDALEMIKNLSWLRDADMVNLYSALLSSNRAKRHGGMLVAYLQLKEYKSEIAKITQSKDDDEAASGFEAFCLLADNFDTLLIKEQFYRIAAVDIYTTKPVQNKYTFDLIGHLSSSRNEACYKVLLDFLDNENEWVRKNAASRLRLWPREETISRMSPLVNDKSQDVRAEAILTLAEIAPDRFIEEAISLSKSKDTYDRAMAAHALGATKLDLAASHLEKLCQDEDETVRVSARTGLAANGTPMAVEVLVRLLESADPRARKEAREALKKLGKEPPTTFSHPKILSLSAKPEA